MAFLASTTKAFPNVSANSAGTQKEYIVKRNHWVWTAMVFTARNLATSFVPHFSPLLEVGHSLSFSGSKLRRTTDQALDKSAPPRRSLIQYLLGGLSLVSKTIRPDGGPKRVSACQSLSSLSTTGCR